MATVTCTGGGRGGGGGSEARKNKVCQPKIDLQVRALLINFIFFQRKIFLMWVGGWGQAEESRLPSPPPSPPPPRPYQSALACAHPTAVRKWDRGGPNLPSRCYVVPRTLEPYALLCIATPCRL